MFNEILLLDVVYGLIWAAVGFPVIILVSRLTQRVLRGKVSDHHNLIIRKTVFATGVAILVSSILIELNFNLTALLGAAGVASIAVGFASQTSLSNVISGLFLFWEKPFEIGDVLTVGDVTGIVLSIDLMSVKIRKFDNQFVRIPNEDLIKSRFTNITRFPIRRMDFTVRVRHGVSLLRVEKILKEIALENFNCLDEPAPLILFREFDGWGTNILFGCWFERSQFIDMRNSMMIDLQERFSAEGIAFAIPSQRVLVESVDARETLPAEADPAAD